MRSSLTNVDALWKKGMSSHLLSFVALESFSFWLRRFRFSILSEKHKLHNVRPPFLLSPLSDSLFLCLSVSLINVGAAWKERNSGGGKGRPHAYIKEKHLACFLIILGSWHHFPPGLRLFYSAVSTEISLQSCIYVLIRMGLVGWMVCLAFPPTFLCRSGIILFWLRRFRFSNTVWETQITK